MEDTQGALLCLPQCDVERPDTGASKSGIKGMGIGTNKSKNKSIKTTAKRADLMLFELPKCSKGKTREDLLEGRCKILANGQYASLVTPSTSLKLVTVGTSNALVVWNKDIASTSNDENNAASVNAHTEEESPTKRRKTEKTPVASCRLVQPGGSGSSFLVGQPRDLDPKELSHFFVTRGLDASISTNELCNLFQVPPKQIWETMLWIPSVVSKYEESNNGKEETWHLVPEEDILFGQQALVETLCEEDDNFHDENDESDGKNASDESTAVTIEAMARKVSNSLLPLLLERTSPENGNEENEKESRCLAIARKTVLLSSSSSYSTKAKLDDLDRRYSPDASRIAFYALRDLFLKDPSYSWPDLQQKWSTRLPMGQRYERITSTTEWIEDGKSTGHGGLVPNQLQFSSTAPALAGRGTDGDSKTDAKLDGDSKAFLSLVDPKAVLIWKGGKY